MFYSPSRNVFYPDNYKSIYPNPPDDLIEAAQEEWVIFGLSSPPEGKRRGASSKGRPIWIDIAEGEEPEPSYFTHKTDIWERCTQDEAETLDTQLKQASVKERRMWDDCTKVEHSSNYYVLLRDNMISAFGEARTDEILSPSNGA